MTPHLQTSDDGFPQPTPSFIPQIGIVGAGISGLMCALKLGQVGYQVTLFESETRPMNKTSSFPIHLHSGVLYPHLDDTEIASLLQDSIVFCQELPSAVVRRPSLICLHVSDPHEPSYLIDLIKRNQVRYRQLVDISQRNKVFGEPDDYFITLTRKEVEALGRRENPTTEEMDLEQWAISFAKSTDLNQVKFPVVVVKEWMMNMDAARKCMMKSIAKLPNVRMLMETKVVGAKASQSGNRQQNDHPFVELAYMTGSGPQNTATFSHLLNAAGESAGLIDDYMKVQAPRFREAKQAFRVTLDSAQGEFWPEVIIMAPRGSQEGMTEVIPLSDCVFQLLATTYDATLTTNGLAFSQEHSNHPQLDARIEKAFLSQDPEDDARRLEAVIRRIAARHPRFKQAKPLRVNRGIVQIPGSDPDHRSGCLMNYSRVYSSALTVKATSAPRVAGKFVEALHRIGIVPKWNSNI